MVKYTYRLQNKNLRKEVAERTQKGEKDLVIRRGKIFQLGVPQPFRGEPRPDPTT